jgi:hypothetical protein
VENHEREHQRGALTDPRNIPDSHADSVALFFSEAKCCMTFLAMIIGLFIDLFFGLCRKPYRAPLGREQNAGEK